MVDSTPSRHWGFSGRVTPVPCKLPLAGFRVVIRIRENHTFADFWRRRGQDSNRAAAFKDTVARSRPRTLRSLSPSNKADGGRSLRPKTYRSASSIGDVHIPQVSRAAHAQASFGLRTCETHRYVRNIGRRYRLLAFLRVWTHLG